ncbi:Calmodulin-like protein [Leptomonas pyrrhocoris]|uniref:Calmodulin-like protein n=1 Tax=Leptomonas pyrrhocoris TaxID=157538 RepID=A0A0M9G990_LEPPY|nr:Calmodulin-like protein [Leptomonas pyrrhocoris]XP_015663900.1 Calmodulin-like protein [Leptomonas pyrrhocoris]KPA85460.1 Calmodulin-like protein [Leptomonas pyrrhocoris]KPA85461.1 Calmodulin-like protein [Leptomonas pyrrhocoris]|eukprot:XP_015663899.1 Calmodulin-like protein [Leptomonas pyrrhocoris]
MSSEYSELTLKLLRKNFDILDKDKIGRVKNENLPYLMRVCGAAPLEANLDGLKAIADPDGRGSFSFDNFCIAQKKALAESVNALDAKAAFHGFDPDKRGLITPHALSFFLTTMGDALTAEEMNSFIEAVQSDADMEGNLVIADVVYKMTAEMYR